MLNPVLVAVHGGEASQRKQLETLFAQSNSLRADEAGAQVKLQLGAASHLLELSVSAETPVVALVTGTLEAASLAELLQRGYFDVLHQSEWELPRLERVVVRASAQKLAPAALDPTHICLDTVFHATATGIACWDKQGRYQHVNPALAAISGMPVEAHYGRTVKDVLPGLAESAAEAIAKVLATGAPITQDLYGTTAAQPDIERAFNVSFYPIHEGNEVKGVAARWEEITHRQEAEKERERFISVLGHDLRNPLSAVLMSGQVLRGRVGDREKVIVDRIKRSALRMQRMIRDLLDFARLRNGRGLQLRATPGDLLEVVGNVITDLKQNYPDAKVQVDAPPGLSGSWDLERVAQVLANLVGNALGHGTAGEEVHLRLSESPPSNVQIEVRNHGQPPNPENLEQLFQPFRAGRAEGNRDSLGLGLFITRALVEAHGGHISLSVHEGQTIASVTLPRTTAGAS